MKDRDLRVQPHHADVDAGGVEPVDQPFGARWQRGGAGVLSPATRSAARRCASQVGPEAVIGLVGGDLAVRPGTADFGRAAAQLHDDLEPRENQTLVRPAGADPLAVTVFLTLDELLRFLRSEIGQIGNPVEHEFPPFRSDGIIGHLDGAALSEWSASLSHFLQLRTRGPTVELEVGDGPVAAA
jgi:hypothetical protein